MSMFLEPNRDDLTQTGDGELATAPRSPLRSLLIPLSAALLVLVALALLAYSLSGRGERPLFPILPTLTTAPAVIESEVTIIGFAELNDDPTAYRGQRIQVSGVYTPVDPPECLNYTGPLIRWSLVAEELQLNAVGFEELVRLLEPGIEMTVSGVWDVYQGPLGCGKEPTDGTVWYLTIDRILEPNPLFGAQAPLLTVIAGESLPTLSPLETAEQSPPEATPTLEGTVDLSPTTTPDAASTVPLVMTETPEATGLPVTPLLTPGVTPNLTGTVPVDLTPGSTHTFGPSPTPGPEGTTTPALPTNTPSGSGYPIPPSPTATSEGYP